MYVCMYVCMYVRMYVCMYVCTYVCIEYCNINFAIRFRTAPQPNQLLSASLARGVRAAHAGAQSSRTGDRFGAWAARGAQSNRTGDHVAAGRRLAAGADGWA
eukprot:COSAG06_NODE_820_length_12102_cov_16.846205_4_plen_102_part_00